MLTADERAEIDRHCAALTDAIARAQDTVAVYHATEALASATETFAARRMNRSIRNALAGKNIDELELPK